jgi:hypothetical protein
VHNFLIVGLGFWTVGANLKANLQGCGGVFEVKVQQVPVHNYGSIPTNESPSFDRWKAQL